jgi:hypothetical protein
VAGMGGQVRDIMVREGGPQPPKLHPVAAAGGDGENAARLLRSHTPDERWPRDGSRVSYRDGG